MDTIPVIQYLAMVQMMLDQIMRSGIGEAH
jgi:hypothetical protein